MSEMIEIVKAAIAEKFAPAIDFKAPYAKVMLDMAARAAIQAMRDPTREMEQAGGDYLAGNYPAAEACFRILSDAALSE